MSIPKFPNLYMYWANEQCILLLQTSCVEIDINNSDFLNVSDNLGKDKPENINKLLKIQPVLDYVRNNCILIEPEREHSTDE